MGRKETEEAIADIRAGRVTRFSSVDELMADLNADDQPETHEGSTNVYADLGHADTDAMLAKARLVTKIGQAIKTRQLSSDQTAAALGLTPAELSELLAGSFQAYSVDDLERLESRLDEARR